VLGLGTAGATFGFTAGTFIAGLIGVALIGVIYRQLPKPASHKREIKAYLTAMLTYCLPLSFATIILLLLPQFYAFLLPVHYSTDNVPIGNYGVAVNFSVIVAFFVMPISTMMFPAFSKLDPQKDKNSLRNIFQFSVKYGSLLVVPMTALVMCLAEPAVATLFGGTYNTAALFLALFVIQYSYTAFGNLSLTALLNGQGQTSYVLRLAVLNGLIGFPLGYVLVMAFGVLGLIAATLVSGVPSLVLGLRFAWSTFGVTVDWGSSARILLSSAVSAAVTFAVISELGFASWLLLLFGACIFFVILVPALLLTRAIARSDLDNLRFMVGGLGVLGRIINRLLSLLEKLMTFLRL
jgi:O-antigen/teichoic acid export membrane protein